MVVPLQCFANFSCDASHTASGPIPNLLLQCEMAVRLHPFLPQLPTPLCLQLLCPAV